VHGQAFGGHYTPERLADEPASHAAIRDKAVKNLEQSFILIKSKIRRSGTAFAVGNSFSAADADLFVLYHWAGAFNPSLKNKSPILTSWASRLLERNAVISALEIDTVV
jgi:glutathione S-transferase